jgi:hypothetical protein
MGSKAGACGNAARYKMLSGTAREALSVASWHSLHPFRQRSASQGGIMPFGHACILLAIQRTGNTVKSHILDPQALEQFQSLLIRYLSLLNISPIKRIQVLVYSSKGCGCRRMDHKEQKPYSLYGFMEASCRICRYLSTNIGHAFEFSFPIRVRFLQGHFLGQFAFIPDKGMPGSAANSKSSQPSMCMICKR